MTTDHADWIARFTARALEVDPEQKLAGDDYDEIGWDLLEDGARIEAGPEAAADAFFARR